MERHERRREIDGETHRRAPLGAAAGLYVREVMFGRVFGFRAKLAKRGQQLAAMAWTLRYIRTQAAIDDPVNGRVDFRHDQPQRDELVEQLALQNLHLPAVAKGELARQGRVQGGGEGVEIATAIDAFGVLELLRRAIFDGAEALTRFGQLRIFVGQVLEQAEIAEFGYIVGRDEDVARFDVAMDQVLAVQVTQPFCDL